MRTIHKVLVFPAWDDNPYLNLLSLAPRTGGFEFSGSTTNDSLRSAAANLGARDVLHLHWTSPILQRCETDADAWAALAQFTILLRDAQERGVRVIWTVHNQLPHELAHRDAEIALYRLLAESVDVIHVMAPATARLVADICELPADRVRMLPHPSYLGVYGVPPSKAEARRMLGVGADEPTVLFLGQMRPYKGLSTLLTAVRTLAERGEPTPTLLLAGSAKPEAQEEIERALPAGARVITRFGFVPDGDVGTWFAAADVAVFPYSAILNSGSLHLSAAFEVPAILPREEHLVEQFGAEPWVRFFDTEAPVESMARLLSDVVRDPVGPNLTPEFDRFNGSISPWLVSAQYSRLLEELVGEPPEHSSS
ncbi:glycosyltransferase [Agromyces allii]|uniref:D-inositol 3-phosphate glycosyltransferase n=1 Tax=Agromyces allii TaxID=393607 RepID=A0ABP5BFY8_9MICO|nr:glycosyltransferase [Agromyces allii]